MTQVTLAAPRPRVARRSEAVTALRKFLRGVIPTAIGLVIFVLLAFPIVWLVDTSFKDAYAARAIPPQYIPLQPTLDVYKAFFAGEAGAATTRELQYWYVMVGNSLYVALLPAVLMIISTFAGHGLHGSRSRRDAAATILLLGQMFPGPSLFVPIYFVVTALGCTTTCWLWSIMPRSTYQSPRG
jgi:ABC-type glycerol-3-phosphate transport system permease component